MDINRLYDFNGKTALITGASSGLGEQFSRVLCEAGARVILASRRLDKLEEISSKLANAKAIKMDVSNKTSIANALSELEKTGEKIDICINNAGTSAVTPIFEEDEDGDFESIIQTNLVGVWYVTKQVANHMRAYERQGAIINIGSIYGDAVPATNRSAYCISKAAVSHLTKTLVDELSPYKIRINCIIPGWFRTPINTAEAIKQITPNIPYGDVAAPSEMDGLILYLSSNEASKYVTGSCFTIDGGISWSRK